MSTSPDYSLLPPDLPASSGIGRVYGGLRKQGIIVEPADTSHYEVFADEGAHLGGDNTAPRPLTYFLLSVGFCALTQLHRYSDMLKVDPVSGPTGRSCKAPSRLAWWISKFISKLSPMIRPTASPTVSVPQKRVAS